MFALTHPYKQNNWAKYTFLKKQFDILNSDEEFLQINPQTSEKELQYIVESICLVKTG